MTDASIDPKLILVVEDQIELRQLYTQLLKGEKYTVDEATNGQEAIDLLKKNAYDLIMLDIMLPGLNGMQVLEWIEKNPATNNNTNKVVILSALGQDTMIASGLSHNIRGYMIKSDYTPEQFL